MRRRIHTSARAGALAATRDLRLLPVLLVAAIALLLAAAAPGDGEEQVGEVDDLRLAIEDIMEAIAAEPDGWSSAEGGSAFAETAIFFEENATDEDLGIQFFLDGDPWERVIIYSPNWHRMLDMKVRGNARVIGLTELFNESAEPSFDELPREDFLALFEEGDYLLVGRTVEGEWLFGVATLTHDLPEQAEIISPEEEEEVDPREPLIVEWELADDPDPPASVIEAYHVVVEKDEADERLRVFAIDMLSTDTSVTVPPEFLEPGKDYKVEILAIETSGNKTITEVPFSTGR